MMRRSLVCTGLVLCVSPALAQHPLHTLTDPSLSDGGFAARAVGDLTGDGVSDVAVGAPASLWPTGQAGVRVHSGADGQLVHALAPLPGSSLYGYAVCGAGDVNGDGVADFAISAPENTEGLPGTAIVELRSGLDASALWAVVGSAADAFGVALAGPGDLDGDGVPDLLVGLPRADGAAVDAGAVRALSGVDGTLLYQVAGTLAGERLGSALEPLLDRDGDGRAEFAAGAPGALRVGVHAGAGGALLLDVPAPASAFGFGLAVDGLGDLDGDGLEELIVGAPEQMIPHGQHTGSVHVLSGSDGAPLFQHTGGLEGDWTGFAVCGPGDVDADGVPDYAFGLPLLSSPSYYPAGAVRVHSGADGSLIASLGGLQSVAAFGYALDALGDANGDGVLELVVGSPGANAAYVSSAEWLVGTPFCAGDGSGTACPCGNENDGSVDGGQAGCAGSASSGGATVRAVGQASLGFGELALQGAGATPGQPGLFFQGDNALGGGLMFGDGLRCVGGNVIRLQTLLADGAGASRTTVDIPALGGLQPGDVRRYQLWYRDPLGSLCGAGFNLSDAVEVVWEN